MLNADHRRSAFQRSEEHRQDRLLPREPRPRRPGDARALHDPHGGRERPREFALTRRDDDEVLVLRLAPAERLQEVHEECAPAAALHGDRVEHDAPGAAAESRRRFPRERCDAGRRRPRARSRSQLRGPTARRRALPGSRLEARRAPLPAARESRRASAPIPITSRKRVASGMSTETTGLPLARYS